MFTIWSFISKNSYLRQNIWELISSYPGVTLYTDITNINKQVPDVSTFLFPKMVFSIYCNARATAHTYTDEIHLNVGIQCED